MLGQVSSMLDQLVQTVRILKDSMEKLGRQVKAHAEALEKQGDQMARLTESIRQL
jgi:hypothetical protein